MFELLAGAVVMGAAIGALAATTTHASAEYHLQRTGDFAQYKTNHEDTLSHAQLWEKKYGEWYDEKDAALYVAQRPGYDGPTTLVDSAQAILRRYHRTITLAALARVLLSLLALGGATVMFTALWIWFGARRPSPPVQAV